MSTKREDYILTRTSEEYQRLRVQARLWEATTKRVLQQAGLGPGMRCLDLGCGPGEVMRLMGEIVGATGQVTGVDVDGNLGNEALGVLQAMNLSQFRFIETDIEASAEIPGSPFDFTYARMTLVHLQDPVAILGKMLRWTKPGGIVLVQDLDFRTWDSYPTHEASAEAVQLIYKVLEKSGLDPYLGYKLPVYFGEAGLGPPDGTDVTGLLTGFSVVGRMTQGVYNNMFPIAQKLGLADETQRQRLNAAIDMAIKAGNYTGSSPLLVSVWKQRPKH